MLQITLADCQGTQKLSLDVKPMILASYNNVSVATPQ